MRKKDYNKVGFKNKAIDRITNGKNGGGGKKQGVTGENTGEVKKDSDGNRYVQVDESTSSGLKSGNIIYIGNQPTRDGYLVDDDYAIKKMSGRGVYKITGKIR
jgi:hypothetical protein